MYREPGNGTEMGEGREKGTPSGPEPGITLHEIVEGLRRGERFDAETAHRLIDSDESLAVAKNLSQFDGLTAETVSRLIDSDQGWAVAENLSQFERLFLEGDSEQDVLFNTLLESSKGKEHLLRDIVAHKDVRDDPVKLRYAARMLLLFPERYRAIAGGDSLSSAGVEAFEAYEDDVRTLEQRVSALAKSDVDASLPAYGLEIEALNVDEFVEFDSPVTNDVDALLAFVEAYDAAQSRIRQDIRAQLPKNRELVGVYDSVHVNIGIPDEKTASALERDIGDKTGIYTFATTVGLIANPIGRAEYLMRHRWEGEEAIVHVDRPKRAMHEVSHGYPAKLQDRFWSFEFARANAPMLNVFLRAVTGLIEQYAKDPDAARDAANAAVEDIVGEMQRKSVLPSGIERVKDDPPLTYGELMRRDEKDGAWRIATEKIIDQRFPSSDLLNRSAIMKFTMRRIAELIPGRDKKRQPPSSEEMRGQIDSMIGKIDEVLTENNERA